MSHNIIKLPHQDNYRIIAISDIHGHLDLFKKLLSKLDLKAEDPLIIIGDFINKGPDNLALLRYIRKLEAERPNTYVLKGNHEYFICHYVYGCPKDQEDRFLKYLKKHVFQSIIHDCIDHGNFDLDACHDLSTLNSWLLNHYGQEFDYINTLPVILFADDLTFVHGGYHKGMDLSNENQLLKYDDYNRLSDVNDGPVIVGHWPTANLRKNRNSNLPYFNHEKNIVSIDGGVGVKTSGELNALVISKVNGKQTMDYLQENHFEKKRIQREHTFHQEDKIFINYPHFDIEVIEKGDLMTLCRHLQSGRTVTIFNTLLEEEEDRVQVKTAYINHFLNLAEGEEVELVMTYEDCALVKHNQEFGWIWNWQL